MEYPISCPECEEKENKKVDMIWQSDFTCEDTKGCNCGNGISSYHYCSECETLCLYTFNCDQIPDDLETVEGNEDE